MSSTQLCSRKRIEKLKRVFLSFSSYDIERETAIESFLTTTNTRKKIELKLS